ncbi:MAG: transglycosylase SLT domain-containing protein [Acetobacteraceae bacterium]|nr:transglycosylase SLT domain-containing protein [Acetobacteraceae bacterium]
MPPATGAPLLRRARALAALAVLTALAACGGPGGYRSGSYAHRDYPRPGPPEDPWRPYIQEAASRFGVPEQWVRAVMRQESGGRDDAISSAGAMGLMQVMPETYEMLRARYGLGEDPYEPHDNIMAGTAYIREMYDRYGAPGFLAAYNAGPNRLDSYLSDGTPLPEETVGYVSSIAPNLGDASRFTGPLSVFAGGASAAPPVAEPTSPPVVLASSACDPDAAYDPDRPCAPSASAGAAPPEPQPVATASSIYVPPPASAEPVYSPPPRRRPMVQLASLDAPATGGWAIQVGAFLSPNAARAAAADARRAASYLLAAAPIDTPPTTPFGGAVLYRARLAALTPQTAAQACARLSAHGAACITVPPGG